MSELQVTARFRVPGDRLDQFRELARRCMAIVGEKDSGTLRYDWFFNDDKTECVVREIYRDSDAVLEHIANLGETMGELLAVAEIGVELFGEPSAQLMQAAAGLSPRVYAPFR